MRLFNVELSWSVVISASDNDFLITIVLISLLKKYIKESTSVVL